MGTKIKTPKIPIELPCDVSSLVGVPKQRNGSHIGVPKHPPEIEL